MRWAEHNDSIQLFINKLEEPLVKGEVLHTCLYDIIRAFDN